MNQRIKTDGGLTVHTRDGVFNPYPEFIDNVPMRERAEWAKHLTSGDYEQGIGAMVIPSKPGRPEPLPRSTAEYKFCCLGVFEHAITKRPIETLIYRLLPERDLENRHIFSGQKDLNPVIAIAELSREDGKEVRAHASDLNDKYKLTFPEIAALICPELELWSPRKIAELSGGE